MGGPTYQYGEQRHNRRQILGEWRKWNNSVKKCSSHRCLNSCEYVPYAVVLAFQDHERSKRCNYGIGFWRLHLTTIPTDFRNQWQNQTKKQRSRKIVKMIIWPPLWRGGQTNLVPTARKIPKWNKRNCEKIRSTSISKTVPENRDLKVPWKKLCNFEENQKRSKWLSGRSNAENRPENYHSPSETALKITCSAARPPSNTAILSLSSSVLNNRRSSGTICVNPRPPELSPPAIVRGTIETLIGTRPVRGRSQATSARPASWTAATRRSGGVNGLDFLAAPQFTEWMNEYQD